MEAVIARDGLSADLEGALVQLDETTLEFHRLKETSHEQKEEQV